jgi:tRNA(Ile)-lysidine synthase
MVARLDDPLDAVTSALGSRPRLVLAVSGGLDSMVLLDAAARVCANRIVAVLTFDHRTGAHASRAVAIVRREAERRGLRVVAGRASAKVAGEAAWREARWSFLTSVAKSTDAAVVTAHTRDDQLETVCMRVLRGAGARGLAGLYAESSIVRPFIALDRKTLERYAGERGVQFVEDPSNASPAHLRNRLRHDLLPAIAAVNPAFEREMLALAGRAATLRHELNLVAAALTVSRRRGVEIDVGSVRGLSGEELGALVPALAARAQIVLDRRGTTRLAEFILMGRSGARIQLSGHAEAVRSRDTVCIRRMAPVVAVEREERLDEVGALGAWSFRRVSRAGDRDPWTAALPTDCTLTVRGWRPGDRMHAAGAPAARRVKRFFRDAGIVGPDREGWPVVLADGEIVWIPGVRRSDAATDRSGRPALRYRFERNDL